MCFTACLSVRLFVSVSPPACLCLCVSPPVCPSVSLSVYVCITACLSARPSVLVVCLYLRLSARASLCLYACCPPTDQRFAWLCGDSHGLVPSCFSARCVWSWTTHCACCLPTDQRFAWLYGCVVTLMALNPLVSLPPNPSGRGQHTVHVVLQQIRDLPGCVVALAALYPIVSPPDPWTTPCTLSSNRSEICLVVW